MGSVSQLHGPSDLGKIPRVSELRHVPKRKTEPLAHAHRRAFRCHHCSTTYSNIAARVEVLSEVRTALFLLSSSAKHQKRKLRKYENTSTKCEELNIIIKHKHSYEYQNIKYKIYRTVLWILLRHCCCLLYKLLQN